MIVDRPASTLLWMAPPPSDQQAARLEAVERQAEALEVRGVVNLADRRAEIDLPDTPARPSLLLLEAAAQAAAHECPQVIWAAHCGSDLESMAAGADRARLAGRLARLDDPMAASLGLRIRTPLLDLSDSQIAELAVDLDAPEDLCWWRLAGAGIPGASEAQERWETAVQRLLTPAGG